MLKINFLLINSTRLYDTIDSVEQLQQPPDVT